MPATKDQFVDAVTARIKRGTIIKQVFNVHGDTAVFLVRSNEKDRPYYSVIRAFTTGNTVHVSFDHFDASAEELLVSLVDIPHGMK